jgi:hypothetical protein
LRGDIDQLSKLERSQLKLIGSSVSSMKASFRGAPLRKPGMTNVSNRIEPDRSAPTLFLIMRYVNLYCSIHPRRIEVSVGREFGAKAGR